MIQIDFYRRHILFARKCSRWVRYWFFVQPFAKPQFEFSNVREFFVITQASRKLLGFKHWGRSYPEYMLFYYYSSIQKTIWLQALRTQLSRIDALCNKEQASRKLPGSNIEDTAIPKRFFFLIVQAYRKLLGLRYWRTQLSQRDAFQRVERDAFLWTLKFGYTSSLLSSSYS